MVIMELVCQEIEKLVTTINLLLEKLVTLKTNEETQVTNILLKFKGDLSCFLEQSNGKLNSIDIEYSKYVKEEENNITESLDMIDSIDPHVEDDPLKSKMIFWEMKDSKYVSGNENNGELDEKLKIDSFLIQEFKEEENFTRSDEAFDEEESILKEEVGEEIKNEAPEAGKKFCNICNKNIARKNFPRHIRNVHGIENEPLTIKSESNNDWNCKYCDFKFSNKSHILVSHERNFW